MVNVIAVWLDGSTENFEKHVPLRFVFKRNADLGSKNNFRILVLDGYHNLSDEYLSELKDLGNEVIDCSKVYKIYDAKFSQFDRFGDYEKKCFLRWLVIKDVFLNEPVIHYDGDFVFNEIPEVLEKALGRYTFVLQGCPAFVSINNTDWLNEYYKNFLLFSENIEEYSAIAWKERNGWQESALKKWAGSRDREIITSDQDLISHLIHTDRLPQADPRVIETDVDLVLFQNPLYIFACLSPDMLPLHYQRSGSIDFINGKKVAFWHMQSSFVRYLEYSIKRGILNKVSRCINPSCEKTLDYKIIRELESGKIIKKLDRIDVYRYYFEKNDFSKVYNSKVFWRKDVFK